MNKDAGIMLSSFPSELACEIKSIFQLISLRTDLYNGGTFDVLINGERIHIPVRIYYDELSEHQEGCLSEVQKQIVDCFFTRHHNGYIRHKKLIRLLNREAIKSWTIPYILQLAGEYVIEIISDIYDNIGKIDEVQLREFVLNNDEFVNLTESRIMSYWNEYYRRECSKAEYVGFKFIDHIKSL